MNPTWSPRDLCAQQEAALNGGSMCTSCSTYVQYCNMESFGERRKRADSVFCRKKKAKRASQDLFRGVKLKSNLYMRGLMRLVTSKGIQATSQVKRSLFLLYWQALPILYRDPVAFIIYREACYPLLMPSEGFAVPKCYLVQSTAFHRYSLAQR